MLQKAVFLVLLLSTAVTAADKHVAPIAVPTPADAVRMAAEDILTIPPADRPYQTYFLTYDRSKEFRGAFNYVINSCISHAATLYQAESVAGGWLLRIDKRRVWPDKDVFEKLELETQKLADIEPYFHTLGEIVVKEKRKVKKTVLEEVEQEVEEKTGRKVSKLIPTGNGYYRQELVDETRKVKKKVQQEVEKEVEEEVEVKKVGSEFSLHLLGADAQAAPIQILAKETTPFGYDINANPIMRADWFIYIVSSSLEEENGRYYQYRLVQNSNDEKTAEEIWLESLGVDYNTIQERQSDQRIAKWRSNVTGKPRAIEYFFAATSRPAVGPGGVAITRDYFVGKVDAFRHVLKNLLNYSYDGSEAMGVLPNGMIEWTLFDGDGGLVTFAPEKLVSDRTIPSPHSTILQTPISCWRCHGSTDMWMPATNEIYRLAKGPRGINIYDDVSDKDHPESTLDRLTGLYSGEMSEFLRINMNTHARATFLATGGMTIPQVAKKIGEIYGTYRYNAVTPQLACLELGWVVTEDMAADHFNSILPLQPKNRFGVHPESITIGTLRRWTKEEPFFINRDDWEQEYADAMLRVQTHNVRSQASKRSTPRSP